MLVIKNGQDTSLIAFQGAFSRNSCSYYFNHAFWKLFDNFDIFRQKCHKPVNVKDLREVAATNNSSN